MKATMPSKDRRESPAARLVRFLNELLLEGGFSEDYIASEGFYLGFYNFGERGEIITAPECVHIHTAPGVWRKRFGPPPSLRDVINGNLDKPDHCHRKLFRELSRERADRMREWNDERLESIGMLLISKRIRFRMVGYTGNREIDVFLSAHNFDRSSS